MVKGYVRELDALFHRDNEGFVVLTPNKRLSRFIQNQYGLYQASKANSAWPTYPCYSLNAWLKRLWDGYIYAEPPEQENLTSLKMLLTPNQELSIWLDTVRSTSDISDLFNPVAAASVAREAWNTLIQWDCDHAHHIVSPSIFNTWQKTFIKFCEEHRLLDMATMVRHLLKAIEQNVITLPEKIFLLAFDDVTPQLQKLIELASSCGCKVENVDIRVSKAQSVRVAVRDAESEITAAARWAAERIEKQPEVKIGVVVPQLAQLREQVERIFTDIFEPQYCLPSSDRHASGFNISAATPLSSVPPVAAALLVLKLNQRELNSEDVSRLLHSPFIGQFEEVPARAMLDAALRKRLTCVTVSELRAAAGEFGKAPQPEADETTVASYTADLYSRLQDFHHLTQGTPDKQPPSGWSALFCAQLEALGWPGDRPLDTLEYQQVAIWQEIISALCGFDYIFPEVTLSRAIELLEHLSFDTQFQAQTHDSPVQILGLFEAAGLVFDYLWVMNIDNQSWPPPLNPNSLLPFSLQKSEKMPMASPEKELLLAKRLTQRFENSANQVVFSHSTLEGDKVLKASPLIEHIIEINLDQLDNNYIENYWQTVLNTADIEAFVDFCGPRIEDPKAVRGGTQILKDQAACPFRAFATHRLGAVENRDVVVGLDAAERGSLIHGALEIIWNKLHHQHKLLALDEWQLDKLITQSVLASFRAIERRKVVGERLKQIECERMHRLLRAWMELEKKRAPFSVIFSETKKSLQLAKLPVNIRYDRVDKLNDDSLFVIDYKTSKLDIRAWSGNRPDEPQVPIYGIANKQTVSGVAFGQINIDQVTYKGISENPDTIPGLSTPDMLLKLDLPDSWPQILEHWDRVLENLAKEFVAGQAEVKPKYNNLTCRYCSLHSLCRIKEFIDIEEGDEIENESEAQA